MGRRPEFLSTRLSRTASVYVRFSLADCVFLLSHGAATVLPQVPAMLRSRNACRDPLVLHQNFKPPPVLM